MCVEQEKYKKQPKRIRPYKKKKFRGALHIFKSKIINNKNIDRL